MLLPRLASHPSPDIRAPPYQLVNDVTYMLSQLSASFLGWVPLPKATGRHTVPLLVWERAMKGCTCDTNTQQALNAAFRDGRLPVCRCHFLLTPYVVMLISQIHMTHYFSSSLFQFFLAVGKYLHFFCMTMTVYLRFCPFSPSGFHSRSNHFWPSALQRL